MGAKPRARALGWGGLLAALALLAGCTSAGQNPVERLAPALRAAILPGEPAPTPPAPTRAALDQVQSALIAVSFADGPRSFVIARADNGGYVTYQDRARRGLVLRGGALSGTDGFANDLIAVRHQIDDPIATPTPPAAWPGAVWRSYQYQVRDGAPYAVTLRCSYAQAQPDPVEIVERRFDTLRIDETCANAARTVTNRYWVDSASGFVWKSQQWVGPDLTPVTIEIIRPYAPG